jgi:hypothetical protein
VWSRPRPLRSRSGCPPRCETEPPSNAAGEQDVNDHVLGMAGVSEGGRQKGAEPRVVPQRHGGGVMSVPGRRLFSGLRDPPASYGGGAANPTCSTGSSTLFAQVRAGRWSCGASRAWARRHCWSTWSSTPRAAGWCAPQLSNRRRSSRSPVAPVVRAHAGPPPALPVRQRAALRSAFGLGPGSWPE